MEVLWGICDFWVLKHYLDPSSVAVAVVRWGFAQRAARCS